MLEKGDLAASGPLVRLKSPWADFGGALRLAVFPGMRDGYLIGLHVPICALFHSALLECSVTVPPSHLPSLLRVLQ